MTSSTLVDIDLKGLLPKVASGKVRDLFAIDEDTLLFVASDRISAYDVVMQNGIPGKGALLTAMSVYWFKYLQNKIPTLKTHFIKQSLPADVETALGDQSLSSSLRERSMQVRRLKIIPVESIVRGYITGSGWAEYKKSGTVNGIAMPPGLVEGQQLPQPLWTPSTKAEAGAKDENINPEKARELIGDVAVAKRVEELSLEIYTTAAKRAEEVGIVLADTKFEFGLTSDNEVVLVDEVLTPDSSRFWPKQTWEQNLGKQQPSFDKQFLRDWLVGQGLKGKEGVVIPEEIARQTAAKYKEAYQMLTGENTLGA
ncbi:phosphoribosylaminoimidazole-succinocarboxamide synthase [Periconia macrospinosa]|uniref:Phosphoribosylaminoimidazole-succinocarboxamide synthase n=1 Tax=Periconia macrospinosa TaxID=97972 RepID=A0A2V1EB13_9PLEO|nr:phosphoribosylaminoimidazole-succinocarboxamide synthase [Periconia macrospinosa]